MTAAVQVRALVAGRGRVPVVHDLDLDVAAGEIVALLGANGAGKTTTLLTIAGVLAPLGGHVEVLGRREGGGRPHLVARRGVALVPESRGVFHSLTVAENLRLARRGRDRAPVEDALELFPALTGLQHQRAGLLSGGEQQMLGLAKALVARPSVLMIDEMSTGLAPIVVERMLPVLRALADERGIAVLLVEQHVQVALDVADRAVVLSRGRSRWSGPAADLRRQPEVLESSYLGG